jgi:hypothetical protein
MDGYLFAGNRLVDWLDSRAESLRREVAELKWVDVKDAAQASEKAANKWRVVPLAVNVAGATIHTSDVPVRVQNPLGTMTQPGTRVSLIVPLSGDPELLRRQPSTWSLNPPRGQIYGDGVEMILSETVQVPSKDVVEQEKNRALDALMKWAGVANDDVSRFNTQLTAQAASAVQARRTTLEQRRQLTGEG